MLNQKRKNRYLLTNGKEVTLTKEQLDVISYPIDLHKYRTCVICGKAMEFDKQLGTWQCYNCDDECWEIKEG